MSEFGQCSVFIETLSGIDDDDEGRINFSVALSPKTTRTCNNKPKQWSHVIIDGLIDHSWILCSSSSSSSSCCSSINICSCISCIICSCCHCRNIAWRRHRQMETVCLSCQTEWHCVVAVALVVFVVALVVVFVVVVCVETLYGRDALPCPTVCLSRQTEGGARERWFRVWWTMFTGYCSETAHSSTRFVYLSVFLSVCLSLCK